MARRNIKDKRRQELIEANLACIAKYGMTGTTITHISQAAGMSRGIINFYFETKDAMMRESLRVVLEEFHQAMESILDRPKEDPQQRLRRLLEAICGGRLINKKRQQVWMAFWGESRSDAALTAMIRESDAALSARLEPFLVEVGVEPGRINTAIALLMPLLKGSVIWHSYGAMSPSEGMAEHLYSFLLQGGAVRQDNAPVHGKAEIVRITQKEKRKPAVTGREDLEGQLDFGDLFGT